MKYFNAKVTLCLCESLIIYYYCVVVVIIVIIPDHYHYHEILIPFIIIRFLKSYLPTTDFIYVKETSYLQTIVVCALVFTRAAQEYA